MLKSFIAIAALLIGMGMATDANAQTTTVTTGCTSQGCYYNIYTWINGAWVHTGCGFERFGPAFPRDPAMQ
ncbi:MAG: hypothetical protein V4596_05510 [Bdellovibrionota bacterium]